MFSKIFAKLYVFQTVSCPGCPVQVTCHLCSFQAHMSRLTCLAVLLRMSYLDCPVPVVLS